MYGFGNCKGFINAFRGKGGKGAEWEFTLQERATPLSDEKAMDNENINIKEDDVRARR